MMEDLNILQACKQVSLKQFLKRKFGGHLFPSYFSQGTLTHRCTVSVSEFKSKLRHYSFE